jgi:hypothetical protein
MTETANNLPNYPALNSEPPLPPLARPYCSEDEQPIRTSLREAVYMPGFAPQTPNGAPPDY